MNFELQKLAAAHLLADESHRMLRLAFGLACANRVRHLMEDPRAVELLDVLQAFVDAQADNAALQAAATEVAHIANHHRGSKSIDGTGHSAVSATYAVAAALAGKALDAAEYAAYSTVYSYGGYAVNDPDAFAPEYAWQVATFESLAATQPAEH